MFLSSKQFLWIIKAQRAEIVIITALATALALGISILFPLQYKATSRLLVILENELNLDSFAASRSAERLAFNLSRIIKSDSFLERVRSTSYKLGGEFPLDLKKRREYWDKKIDADVVPGTAVLEISAYDTDRTVAASTVQAISEVLALQGTVYHGGGDRVRIQVIDFPLSSKYPKRPNLILNGILGVLLGLLIALIYETARFKKFFESYEPPISAVS